MNEFSLGKFGGKAGLGIALLGLAVIGIGINGVRSQFSLLAQMPYVISGGILGLALVILGAAVLIVQGGREDRALLEAKLDRLADAILESAATTRPTGAAHAPGDVSGLLVAGTASYHVPTCRLVDGREQTSYVTADEARDSELKACRVCQPDQAGVDVTVR